MILLEAGSTLLAAADLKPAQLRKGEALCSRVSRWEKLLLTSCLVVVGKLRYGEASSLARVVK